MLRANSCGKDVAEVTGVEILRGRFDWVKLSESQ
jgi:hypothetical protein